MDGCGQNEHATQRMANFPLAIEPLELTLISAKQFTFEGSQKSLLVAR